MANNRDVEQDVFSFPTRSACKRCGSLDTTAYSTQGKVQYRQCRRIGCRIKFTVIGTKVNNTKEFADEQKTKQPEKAKPASRAKAAKQHRKGAGKSAKRTKRPARKTKK